MGKSAPVQTENLPEVDVGTLARVLGIGLRTAQRLSQIGVLNAVDVRGRTGKKYYSLSDSVQAYIAYVREQYESKDDKQNAEQLKADKLRAEVDLKQSQGELHRIKTAITKGEYLPVEEVQDDYERFFVVLKKFMSAVPARVGGTLTGYVDPVVQRRIEKDLQTEMSAMLRTFVVAGKVSDPT